MKKINKILSSTIAVFFIFLSATVSVSAQERKNNIPKNTSALVEIAEEPAVIIGGMRITIGQAIKQAIKQNHDILSGSYDVAMTDTYLMEFYRKYAINMTAESGAKYQKNPEAISVMNGTESRTLDAGVGLSKLFSSGTGLSAGFKDEYGENQVETQFLPVFDNTGAITNYMVPIRFAEEKYNMPVFYAGVRQELLKNGFGYNDRRQEKILKNTGDIQRYAILEALSMLVVGVIVDYWNVAITRTDLVNSELQVAQTKNLRDITLRNVKLGLADEFNLNYYNLLVSGAEASLLNSRQKNRNAVRKFLSSVNMDENVDIAGTIILTDTKPDLNENSALKSAFSKRADYKNALLALENAKMDLEINRNNSMPSITAELTVSALAYDEDVARSYSDTASLSYPSLDARIRVTYPLGDTQQEVKERNAEYKLKQARINLDKTRRSVRDDIFNKIEKINTMHSIYLNSREARVQAERFYNKMLSNLRKGRLDSATVKNGLDALINSRQQELTALVYFNISLLELDVAKNELWERYNINVNDYIPGKKS